MFKLLLDEGRITRDVIDQMRSWRHSGFSVDKSVALAAGDTAGLERLAAYMVRCPFSVDRILSVSDDGKVVYRAEKAECQRFPILGGEMKIIAFIERRDPPDVVRQILRHCALRDRPASRAPPPPTEPQQLDPEPQYILSAVATARRRRVDTDAFLMAL